MQHPAIRFNSASAFLYLIFHTTFNTPDLLVGWFLTLHKNPLVSMVLSVYLDKSIGSFLDLRKGRARETTFR